jgi:hypothetical protein
MEYHALLHQLMQRCSNGAKILDEIAVETCKTKKTSHLCDGLGYQPALYGFNLHLIHLNFLWSNNIAKKRDSIHAKDALLKVTKQSCIS